LKNQKNSPTGDGTDATDQPGLKEMTLKAIDILQARSKGQGWFMMFVTLKNACHMRLLM
jgi:alkaline phosphatase